jgi:NitT/TauT family transport system permease protein
MKARAAMDMNPLSAIRSRLQSWLHQAWLPILFVILLFGTWEASVWAFDIALYILPPPSVIAEQFVLRFDRIWEYTLVTGGETLVGFLVAVVLGVPLSLVIAFSWVLRRTLYPLAVSLEMVPKIAFAPMFVTWLGFSFVPKIIIVFMVCFFPILLNGILAFTSLSEELLRFARSTGAGVLTTFFRVRLPAALPQLFVGIKGAAVNATVGATVSEWVGGDAGLGYYIQIASGDLRMDIAFAIIFMLAALGLALFGVVVLIERALIPWHISQRTIAGAGL